MMVSTTQRALVALILGCTAFTSLEGAYSIRQGRLVNEQEMPTLSIQEHYSLATAAEQRGDYKEAVHQFRVISNGFPGTRIGQEALYHLGKA